MRSPQTLTRRLVPALAVTVVSTLLFGALVVTADVADGAEPVLPETFAVAAPKQGDAWRYNVTLSGDWTFGLDDEVKLGEPTQFAQYQWAGTAKVRGGDGYLHDVNRLQAQQLVYEPLWLEELDEEVDDAAEGGSEGNASQAQDHSTCVMETYDPDDPTEEVACGPAEAPYWRTVDQGAWVLAGGRNVVSRGDYWAENASFTNYGLPFGTGLMAEYSDMYSSAAFLEFPEEAVPCLTFTPLQLGNVSLAGAIGLFDACQMGGQFLAIPDGLAFEAKAVDTVNGVQAVLFEGRLNGTYRAWFTPAVPYPVRFEADLPSQRQGDIELGERDLPGKRSFVLDLVGFAGGSDDLLAADVPTDAAPDLAYAAPLSIGGTRVGPDDAGLEHPFPLSVAFQAALDAANYQDLKTYLASNPDGYVAAAYFTEGNDVFFSETSAMPGEYAFAWTILMHNGQESFLFTAAKVDYSTLAPTGVRTAVSNATGEEPVYQFHSGGNYYNPYGPYDPAFLYWGARAPYPSGLPDAMPTAESLVGRWTAFDASGTPANNYGFTIGCSEADQEECDVEVVYFAGHSRQSRDAGAPFWPMAIPTDPYGTEQTVIIERHLTMKEDGRGLSLSVYDERQYRSAAGPASQPSSILPPPAPIQDPGYDVQSTEVTGIPSSSLSWVPQGKEAASIGFMGIVVGALYWVWPKLGVVGLFSRLHRGELLDHPARAKLVQIVESQPGIHFHDLAQKADLANGTAVHHLRKLSDSGHLNVRRSGRYTCYFPGGRVDPHTAAAAPLLKSDGAKLVLEAVRGKPGMSNLELAQATGLQPSTVNYHVQRLAAAGLVAALRDGRNVRLHPGVRAGAADATPAAAA